jgi:hypothetical protein
MVGVMAGMSEPFIIQEIYPARSPRRMAAETGHR